MTVKRNAQWVGPPVYAPLKLISYCPAFNYITFHMYPAPHSGVNGREHRPWSIMSIVMLLKTLRYSRATRRAECRTANAHALLIR